MDPLEEKAGVTEDNFWHRAKVGLIRALLSKAGGRGRDILVIGCGTGNDLKAIREFARRLVVCDINCKALKSIKGDALRICSDAASLPLKDSTMDVVLSLDVFEHIHKDSKAISECRRVLRNKGHLIFTVPAWSGLYSGFDRQVSHVRRYDKTELETKLAGFKKVYLSYWNFILFPFFAAERLARRRLAGFSGKNSDVHDAARLPKLFNEILYRIMWVDNALIQKDARLPWGLSLCGIYQKK